MTHPPRLLPFIAVATLLVAVLFSDALLFGGVLTQADLLYRFAPWSAHVPSDFTRVGNDTLGDVPYAFVPFLVQTAASFRAGQLPLWSPALFGGQPFLASYQTAIFSPFTLPAIALSPADTLLAAAIGKLLAGGVGMWLFLRRLGLSSAAIWFGATAYLLNPFSLVWIEHPLSAAAAWLPWVLWSVDRLLFTRAPGDVARLAVVVGVTILAGHPETSYKVLLLAGAYAVAGSFVRIDLARDVGDRLRRGASTLLTRFVPAGLLALLLAAVQLLPFAEYLVRSSAWEARRAGNVGGYAAPLETAITAIVPKFLGNPSTGVYLPMENAYGGLSNFHEQQVYPGISTWVFAAIGLVATRRTWRTRFFGGAGLLGALLMYGAPGVVQAFELLPGASVVALSRFGLVVIASAIVLAALGVDALTRRSETPVRPAVWPAVAIVALMALGIAAFLAWAWRFLASSPLAASTPAWCAFALAMGVATIALVRWRTRMSSAGFATLATLLIGVDLLILGWRYHPAIPRQRSFPPLPELSMVARDRGLFRVTGLVSALPPNSAMVYGLQDLRGMDGVGPSLHAKLLALTREEDKPYVGPGTASLPVLDLMNVKYVFGDGEARLPGPHFTRIYSSPRSTVFRNERVFPRAFLVHRARVVSDEEALRTIGAQGVDLRQVALLSAPISIEETPEEPDASTPGVANVAHYEDTRVVVDVTVPRRALLVLADLDYPGWTATVDATPLRVLRANYALRAVAVPAGRHRVTFTFEPQSFRFGLGASLAGLVGVMALAWVGRRG